LNTDSGNILGFCSARRTHQLILAVFSQVSELLNSSWMMRAAKWF